MSAQPGLLSMAQQFSGLPMKSLIGAPLNAAAEANAMMGKAQTQYLLSTCFHEPATEGAPRSPIMITMEITRSVVKADGTAGTPVKTQMNLPILTILPLNSLAVDDVSVDFEMEVKSSFSNDKETSQESEVVAEAGFEAKIGYGCFSAEVHGSVKSTTKSASSDKSHYEKSNSAKYTVHVHAGQLPLPQGVTTIIDAYSKAIEPILLKEDKANP
jgi:hypothetical protein